MNLADIAASVGRRSADEEPDDGVDIITFDGDQIVELKVMVRPLKAVNAVWKQMGKMLEQLKAAG